MAMRLAARQGLSSLRELAPLAGTTAEDILAGRSAETLAELAGFSRTKASYVAISIEPASRTAKIGAEPVFINDFSLAWRRWCSPCLREDMALARQSGEPESTAAWSRPEWDLQSVAACPRHLRKLSDACPACARAQDWLGPAIDRCQCGAYLAEEDGPPVSAMDVEWEKFVVGRLAGNRGPRLLAPDPIRTLVSSVERLGFAANLPWTLSRQRACTDERIAARRAGMATLADWPRAFHAALSRVCIGMGGDERPRGLIGGYGWIYGEWAYLPPVTRIDAEVRAELRGHAVRHAIVAQREPVFGRPQGHTISMTAAARVCGMGYSRARQLLDAEGVIPAGVRRGVEFPLCPNAVAAVITSRPARGLLTDAAADLGVGRTQARRLRTRFDTGRADWSRDLLSRLRHCAVPGGTAQPHLRPLPDACRTTGVRLEEACGFVLQNALLVRAESTDRSGLHALMVDPSRLRSLGRNHMGVERTAKRIGIHHEAMRWLINAGEVRRTERGVCPASLDAFDARYLAAGRLAAHYAVSHRMLGRILKSAGVLPAFGPPLCRQVIYDRADATAALRGLVRLPETVIQ